MVSNVSVTKTVASAATTRTGGSYAPKAVIKTVATSTLMHAPTVRSTGNYEANFREGWVNRDESEGPGCPRPFALAWLVCRA